MSNQEVLLEFYNEAQHLGCSVDRQLRLEVEHNLLRLQTYDPTLQKAVVAIEQPIQPEFSHFYQGRIVIYDGSNQFCSTAWQTTPVAALQEAFRIIEKRMQRHFGQQPTVTSPVNTHPAESYFASFLRKVQSSLAHNFSFNYHAHTS